MDIIRHIKRTSTKFRIAIGLCSITVTLMIIANFIGLLPNEQKLEIEKRAELAQIVATNATLLITQSEIRRMETLLKNIMDRQSDLVFATIETAEGKTLSRVGEADDNLQAIAVPVWEGENKWGEVKLFYTPMQVNGLQGFLQHPGVPFILFVSSISFIFYFFYLGRMLKLLDPSQAIPDRVRSALDTMAEGLLVLDARQNIVLANRAFAHIMGKSSEELIGFNCRAFKWRNTDDREFVAKDSPWGRALASGQAVTSARVRLDVDAKRSHTFMVNCSPVLANSGKAGGVLVSFDDVTVLEQKEIELLKSKQEAEIANQSKSDFLANMSHEIRTPMNAIMGFTEVLRRGYSDAQNSDHFLDTIAKNSRHLLELINDILDLSKVESGQIDIESIACSPHEIIHDVLEALDINARNKGIGLEYTPLTELPKEIITDPARLRQIVTNLVGNAIKFTQHGKVTVTTAYGRKGAGSVLEIKVLDTGIGMTPAQQAQVFSPFVQADSSITRRFGGTGLGLTISKKFAQALGGDIKVRSQTGKGSEFTLSLVVAEVAKSNRLSIQQIKQHKSSAAQVNLIWSFPSAEILVVDDSEENRELIKLVLEHQGMKVDQAVNGLEATEAVAKKSYQMLLMDVQMPVMDGYTAIGIIRKSQSSLPVYALTAHAMKGIEQKCRAAGFNGYIPKPISINGLLNSVAQCVGGSCRESTASAVPLLTQPLHGHSRAATQSAEKAPVVSILQSNPKYHAIIVRFIDKLGEQLEELNAAIVNKNFEDLAELAHKLKGSAGTVGFYSFTEPFHNLEVASGAKDLATIQRVMSIIEAMYKRIDKANLPNAEKSARQSGP